MQLFRSHIARFASFFMLLVGMAFHFAKPVNDKANQDAFTSWLGSHLKTQDDSVLDRLDEISSKAKALDTVIREASEFVLTHSDEFELPVSKKGNDSSPEDFYQLLITEWTNYQNSSGGMGTAVFVQNMKPQIILPSDGHVFSSAITKHTLHFDVDQVSDLGSQELSSGNSYTLSPLKSGTAIGAP